jgi:hypothetical protein
LAKEVTTKNSVQLIINNKLRVVENYLIQNQSKETICKDILSRDTSFETNYEQLFTSLNKAIKKYEIMIESDNMLIKHNFFSLDETDISKIEYNFNKCFEEVNKNTLNKLIFDNNLSIDEGVTNALEIRKSVMNSTSSHFFVETHRCEQLAKMCLFYKRVHLIIKRITKVMKNVGIENFSIYTRFRFDSQHFLAFNREQVSHYSNLKADWARDAIALKNIRTRVINELDNETVMSSKTYFNLKSITQFLIDFSEVVFEVESILKQEWEIFNQNYIDLNSLNKTGAWISSQ